MREVHGRPFLLQKAGEFPAAREHDLPLSADARRYADADHAVLLDRLEAIEGRANGLKVPLGFTDQFYVLREHIQLVRRRLKD